MIILAGVFSLAYLWFTLFPGRVAPEAGQYFSAGEISRGREYSQAMRLIFIGGFAAEAAFLIWLVFGGKGAALSRWAQQLTGGYWGSVLVFFLTLWLFLRLINLPFALYGGFFWQRRWGFSTQTMGSWWADYLKGAGLDLALSAAGVLLLFWIINRRPHTWWLAGAAFFSIWLVIQTLIWPVLVSPLFNRFVPARDPAVINMVRKLSQKAGLPVDQVLVMDASRRTTRANAYFAGLGPTRRIVLYDTLLADYPPDQVEAVVAHEMAHWRQGHIYKGLSLGILGSFAAWGLLFLLLGNTMPVPLRHPPPVLWAVTLLFFMLVSFAASPVENYVSRIMEEEADRVAVTLTGNAPAAVRLQVNLAAKNLADVSPPAFIRWFSYSHPPALARIENILKAGAAPGRTLPLKN
ncbi:MAG: M48 family metallopeptidase [Peptococcaceae bacterium]|nr:M48 family metallopeptidase [Peptococcaceae bacterium]